MKNYRIWILGGLAVFVVLACIFLYERAHASFHDIENGGTEAMNYKSITMEEAKVLFETEGSYLIVDVRRPDEYASGHIPAAINIPNESIGTDCPAELPDKDQLIYVYCRSGNRSKQASKKLVDLGYRNIVEFGGILDWTGETVQ